MRTCPFLSAKRSLVGSTKASLRNKLTKKKKKTSLRNKLTKKKRKSFLSREIFYRITKDRQDIFV